LRAGCFPNHLCGAENRRWRMVGNSFTKKIERARPRVAFEDSRTINLSFQSKARCCHPSRSLPKCLCPMYLNLLTGHSAPSWGVRISRRERVSRVVKARVENLEPKEEPIKLRSAPQRVRTAGESDFLAARVESWRRATGSRIGTATARPIHRGSPTKPPASSTF
jgi:hypothetical protein